MDNTSTRVVAIAIQKGGVGKTTTAVNLSAALADQGLRVLLLDLDPQGQTSDHFGLRDQQPTNPMLQVLQGLVSLEQAACETESGVHVVACGEALAMAEPMLQAEAGGELALRERLAQTSSHWDFIILDCPPSLGVLTISALSAATEVLVPLPLEGATLDGLGLLSRTLERIKARTNPGLRLLGVLPNMASSKTCLAKDVLSEIQKYFPGALFETQVRRNVRISEAYCHKTPVIHFAPKSPGASDFRAVADEVLGRAVGTERGVA